MKTLKTLKQVYKLHENVLTEKPFYEYTEHDVLLRILRSTIEKYIMYYDKNNLDQINQWIQEFEQERGEHGKIIANTWRWIIGSRKKLQIKIRG